MIINVQCHTTVTLTSSKRWDAQYSEILCTTCPISCSWQTSILTMNEWMKIISKKFVNKLHFGFYYHKCCQILCSSVSLFLSLSVFISSRSESCLRLYWLSCLLLIIYSGYFVSVVLTFKYQILFTGSIARLIWFLISPYCIYSNVWNLHTQTHTHEYTHIICNIYWFSTEKLDSERNVFLIQVQCFFCSILLSIAVHIHSVFCVPCNVCDNVQQCDGTAIVWR